MENVSMENVSMVIKPMKDVEYLKKRLGKKIRIYLMNGFVKKGIVKELHEDHIIFRENGSNDDDMIYRHAISTFGAY